MTAEKNSTGHKTHFSDEKQSIYTCEHYRELMLCSVPNIPSDVVRHREVLRGKAVVFPGGTDKALDLPYPEI